MSRHRSTEARVAALALSLLVAAVAVLGSWQVVTARHSQQTELERADVNAAHLASSALASALESRLQLLSNLAGQPGVAAIFSKEGPAQLDRVTLALHELYPGFSSFEIVDPAGLVKASWPAAVTGPPENLSGDKFWAAARSGRPYVSGAVRLSSGAGLSVMLFAPVRQKSGAIAGFIAASVPGASLGPLIGAGALEESASLVVLDQSGDVLFGPAAGTAHSFKSIPVVAGALGGRMGGASSTVPGYRGSRLVGYAPVPALGWVVLVEQPYSVLDQQVMGLTERLGAIGLMVVLAALGTGLLVVSLFGRLGRERQRAQALMTSVGEGVATLGYDGTVQDVNPALEELTGCPRADLVGSKWHQTLSLYDPRGGPVPWEGSLAYKAAAESKVVSTTGYSLFVSRSDGQRVPVSMTAAPLRLGEQVVGSVVVLRDVSNEREVDQLKSSLVSTVSHELRTPLTMVQGFAELLLSRDDLGAERSREALGQILSSAQRLGRLIDDLLSVSRIDSGKLHVDLGAVSLDDAVVEATRVAASQPVNGRGLPAEVPWRLVVDLPPNAPPVMADRDKLVQVLVNLLSNALKYSSPLSQVRVTARECKEYLEISVADQGIGMSEEERSLVFEKFSRADRPDVRQVAGTGLGLYITKSLVEMQHGQIWVESALGKGTTFTFALPRVAPRAGDAQLAVQGMKEQE
ncbi:MAG TPA: ATP-binding protein [Acidimicrobiales bacterium]|nr:ATP-binding protein [Acidimicrobiales bacterium]